MCDAQFIPSTSAVQIPLKPNAATTTQPPAERLTSGSLLTKKALGQLGNKSYRHAHKGKLINTKELIRSLTHML